MANICEKYQGVRFRDPMNDTGHVSCEDFRRSHYTPVNEDVLRDSVYIESEKSCRAAFPNAAEEAEAGNLDVCEEKHVNMCQGTELWDYEGCVKKIYRDGVRMLDAGWSYYDEAASDAGSFDSLGLYVNVPDLLESSDNRRVAMGLGLYLGMPFSGDLKGVLKDKYEVAGGLTTTVKMWQGETVGIDLLSEWHVGAVGHDFISRQNIYARVSVARYFDVSVGVSQSLTTATDPQSNLELGVGHAFTVRLGAGTPKY